MLVQYGNTDDFFTCFTAIQVITEEVQVQVVTEDLLLWELQFNKCHKEMCAINKEIARSHKLDIISKIMESKYNMNIRAKKTR